MDAETKALHLKAAIAIDTVLSYADGRRKFEQAKAAVDDYMNAGESAVTHGDYGLHRDV